jgi:XTP/dITP diphosphohydrolase
MKEAKCPVLADDSGLEVDYLNKEPGIYSARYLGEDISQREKNLSIIERLKLAKGIERKARFVCAMACVFPDGRIFTSRGEVEGLIGYEEKGQNGFGYDPIFYVPEYELTMAEMEKEQKNSISHRYVALRRIGGRFVKILIVSDTHRQDEN